MPHHNTRKRPAEVRFWEKVAKAGPDDCWLWTASTYLNGYGQLGVEHHKHTSAHRYSYELHYGPIPKGMVVMHTCDTPRCTNPAHLTLGTQIDNIEDMRKKGRADVGRGENKACAKLTEKTVKRIRSMHATGQYTYTALAHKFNVSMPTIRSAVLRLTWAHVD